MRVGEVEAQTDRSSMPRRNMKRTNEIRSIFDATTLKIDPLPGSGTLR